MRFMPRLLALALVIHCSLLSGETKGQYLQQGTKLVGTGAVGNASQGSSVAISADGNTAIVGGCYDNANIGAAWVFTRSAGVWTQQGSKLVGTGAVGGSLQGITVAISADGNTALVGGQNDNGNVGAAWVFTRSGGVWSQQGSKLVGSGAVGAAQQGGSVSLSADGNTAIVGGLYDDGNVGAAWVFTRSGGVWNQQGAKLVGTGAIGKAWQGGVALSGDGNIALVGGSNDNGGVGAAWVFTRSGGVWSQQGSKLVGSGAVGSSHQGAVSVSGDGNTAVVGGYGDNGNIGAVWVFTRSGNVWTQQGAKLVGSGYLGTFVQQGYNVSLSFDGNTFIQSSPVDNSNTGAVWVFKRSGGTWSQQGDKLVGTGAVGNARQGQGASLSSDGSTIVLGGTVDNGNTGAAWVFVEPPPLLAGLIAYYPFNGNAYDESGNSHNGTVNGAVLAADRFGNANSSYYFASQSYISVPHDPAFNVTGDMTVSAWFKADSPYPGQNAGTIIAKRPGNATFWEVAVECGGHKVGLALFNNFSSLDYHFSDSPVTYTVWNHVVTVVKNDSSYIWINGVLDSVDAITIPRPSNTSPVTIGDARVGNYEWFTGSIDDIRIYNRALSVTEVKSLFQQERVNEPPEAPQGLTAFPGNGQITLLWRKVSDPDIRTYRIYKGAASPASTLVDSTTSPSDTARVMAGLSNGSVYYFRVTAVDSAGLESNFSTEVYGVPNAMANGLIAYYPFNGNSNDESGNGRHATAHGVSGAPDRFGRPNSAYSFDGVNDYLKASGVGLPSATRTTSLWFKANSLSEVPTLISYGSICGRIWLQGVNHNSSGAYAVVSGCGVKDFYKPYGSPPVGSWTNWVVTTGPSGTKFYVNGSPIDSSSLFFNDTYVAVGDLSFGVAIDNNGVAPYTNASSRWYNGILDDIRIYDYPLSSSQVDSLYRLESTPPEPDAVVVIAPPDGFVTGADTATVSWYRSGPVVVRYWVELSTDSLFQFTKIDSVVADTSYVIRNLAAGKEYWWRVRAYSGWSYGPFSSVRSVHVVAAPTQVQLLLPAHGQVMAADTAVLSWQQAEQSVDRYMLEIATDSLFQFRQSDSTLVTLSYVAHGLSSASTYWWRVKAHNAAGWGPFSSKRNFSALFTGLDEPRDVPQQFALDQNYPNPFNPSTTIRYGLPERAQVAISVFNTLGQEVAALVQGEQEAGYHEVRFDASGLSSGVYLYRMTAGSFVRTCKLLLLR